MPFKLDHIVIAVDDLETAIADYSRLGFNVYPGGTHHGGVSHNALVILADGAYFELIAYLKDAPGNRWFDVLRDAGEGFVDFALLPEDTVADIEAARARGLVLEGPTPGGRMRLDGERLDWLTVRPETTDLPFWCGDVTRRSLRVPDGDMRVHTNGALGVDRLRVVVRDLAVSAARYVALLGRELVGAEAGVAHASLGRCVISIAEPWDGESLRLLETRGEGLAAVTLATDGDATLDLSLTHGAALKFAG